MQTLSQVQLLCDQHLSAYCTARTPHNLYEPVHYILGLGGKRIRPLLLASAYLLNKQSLSGQLLDACLAVEMFHNFTLVHDDIMDEAPVRRGQPTVHQRWNVATAILSGDVMLIEVYRLLEQACSDDQLRPVLKSFNQTAVKVCEGQQLDMDFESRKDVTMEDYMGMIGGKTACLLGTCLELGGLLGGLRKEEVANLYELGESIGISFQLKDDFLDIYGSTKTGKQRGGDILRNKKTALYAMVLQEGTEEQKADLFHLYSPTTSHEPARKIAQVMELFEISGAKARVEEEVQKLENKAQGILNQLEGRQEGKHLLLEIFALLSQRVS